MRDRTMPTLAATIHQIRRSRVSPEANHPEANHIERMYPEKKQ
jgi:hypothetical protein